MQINKINNNQTGNTSFTALKGMKYNLKFNPNGCRDDAKAVQAFLKNDEFKNMCKKFDVLAIFTRYDDPFFGINNISEMTLLVKKAEVPKTFIEKIKSIFKPSKNKKNNIEWIYRISDFDYKADYIINKEPFYKLIEDQNSSFYSILKRVDSQPEALLEDIKEYL